MVWKSTKQIGCAVALGPWKQFNDAYYVGCNYLPAGNALRHYSENVSPPNTS